MAEIETRKMKLADFFRLGNIREYDGEDIAGDSVFIRKDRSLQGMVNHFYQRLCLFSSLAFGRSPIGYTASVATAGNGIVGVCWHRGSDKLVGIFVNSKFRRMGIGYMVAAKLCELVKDEMRVMYYDYDPALKIFAKLGFAERSKSVELARQATEEYNKVRGER